VSRYIGLTYLVTKAFSVVEAPTTMELTLMTLSRCHVLRADLVAVGVAATGA
jgi:hypothetical protein